MKKLPQRVIGDEGGATAIEYGLILALVVLAAMVALNSFADATINMWDDVSNKVVKA